jgi:hypothetical protein
MMQCLRICALLFALAVASGPVWAATSPSTEVAFGAPVAAQWEIALMTELADSPQYSAELASAINSAAAETGTSAEVLWGVAYTESHSRHWNERGRVKRGGAGEVGLMQVKPFWTKALKREYGVVLDLYKLADNVRAGAYILSRGGSDIGGMLGYYNTGKQVRGTRYQRKVQKYLASLDNVHLPAPEPVLMVSIPRAEVSQPQDAALPLAPGGLESIAVSAVIRSAVDENAARTLVALHAPAHHLNLLARRDSFSRRP